MFLIALFFCMFDFKTKRIPRCTQLIILNNEKKRFFSCTSRKCSTLHIISVGSISTETMYKSKLFTSVTKPITKKNI